MSGGSNDGYVLLASHDNREERQDSWALDSVATVHICRNHAMFDNLHRDGEYKHINMGGDLKMKVNDMGSVQMKVP